MTYQEIIEKRNKEEEQQAKNQGFDKNKMSPDGMMKGMKGMLPSMPKMPSMGGFKF